MFPAAFDYEAPSTLTEVLSILKQRGDDAKVMAGGQSLIPLLKLRFAQPQLIVDIGRIPGLAEIKRADPHVAVVALDLGQSGDPADVDDQLRLREAELEERDEALASGHHLGVIAALFKDGQDFGEGRRSLIVKSGRKHQPSSQTRQATPREKPASQAPVYHRMVALSNNGAWRPDPTAIPSPVVVTEAVKSLSAEEISELCVRHTLYDWSAQAGLKPLAVDSAKGVYIHTVDGKGLEPGLGRPVIE